MVAGLYFAREVLVPVAVALLLTFLLAPLVHRLEHLRVPRIAAVLISVAFSFAILGGIGWLISDQATDLAVKIGSYQGDIEQKIKKIHGYFGHGAIAVASRAIDQMAQDVATSQSSGQADSASWLNRRHPAEASAVQFATRAPKATPLSKVSATPFSSSPQWANSSSSSFSSHLHAHPGAKISAIGSSDSARSRPSFPHHPRLDDASTRISKYLLAQSAVNGVFGIIVGVGLYLIHIPNAPLWGLICGILRFIPYLGVWIGAIFPIILSFVNSPTAITPLRPFLTIGLFVVTELTAANAIRTPALQLQHRRSPLAGDSCCRGLLDLAVGRDWFAAVDASHGAAGRGRKIRSPTGIP